MYKKSEPCLKKIFSKPGIVMSSQKPVLKVGVVVYKNALHIMHMYKNANLLIERVDISIFNRI